jgi:alkanesulfonate monooxygenase SsuD/methylene tetrahydromethanopterin reductase-like flavin-dependent oxidoreductase (luciferase family)
MDYQGEFYKQPRVEIRPRPQRSFKGRTFAAAVSPASMELMARLGVGILVIAQKPWATAVEELHQYRQRFVELNGFEAPKPILVLVAGVSHDRQQVQRMRDVYLQRWARSTVECYEFENQGFASIPGYEYYGALAANIAKHGLERFNGFLADLQVWGTPDEVTEKLLEYVELCDAGGVVIDPTFGGMPYDEAEANFEVLVDEVLPVLKSHDVGGDIGVTYGASVAASAP